LDRHKIRKNKCLSINKDDIQLPIKQINNPTQTIKIPQNTTQINLQSDIHTTHPHKEPNNINTSKTYCKNCNKHFSRYDSLKRHQLFYCLPKDDELSKDNNNKNVIDLLSQIKNQQTIMKEEHKQEIADLKNTIINLESKIKNDTTNITNNNTTNNTINNTININNNIVFKFGTKIDHNLITTEKLVHFLNHITSLYASDDDKV